MVYADLKFTGVTVTSFYGNRILNGRPNFHKGVDTANGTTYAHSAFGAGRVIESPQRTKHPEYGWYVKIEHAPGIATSHHSLIGPGIVKVGQQVTAGQIIGNAGESALGAKGRHVHNGLWINGQHVNSLQHLIPGQVRRLILNPNGTFYSTAVPLPGASVSKPEPTPIVIEQEEDVDMSRLYRNQKNGEVWIVNLATGFQWYTPNAAYWDLAVKLKMVPDKNVIDLPENEFGYMMSMATLARQLSDESGGKIQNVSLTQDAVKGITQTLVEAVTPALSKAGVSKQDLDDAVMQLVNKVPEAVVDATAERLGKKK